MNYEAFDVYLIAFRESDARLRSRNTVLVARNGPPSYFKTFSVYYSSK